MAQRTDGVLIGGGKLFIRKYNEDGTLGLKHYFGLTDDLSYNIKLDYVEHKNTEAQFERTDFKAIKSKSASIKFKTTEITAEMLALALAGNSTDVSQAGGSVSDEEHGASEVVGGAYVDLANIKVSNVVVKYQDGDNTDTAVEGTDYNVDYDNGMLYIIAGGAIDGKDIKVDYDFAKLDITAVEGLIKKQVLAQLEFYGDPQNGKKMIYKFYKVQLSASGDISLKDTSKFIELSFNGEVLATDNQDNPYFNVKVASI